MRIAMVLRRWCRFAPLSVILVGMTWSAVLATSGPQPSFHTYTLKHASADVVEPQLKRMLSGVPGAIEVVADRQMNRLLVSGPREAHALTQQLVRSVDQAPPQASEPVLKTYPMRGDLDAVVAELERRYAQQPEIRITGDRRTSQILVLAPPAIQAEVAKHLEGNALQAPAAEPRMPAAARRPAARQIERTVQLRDLTPERLHSSLQQVIGRELPATELPGGQEMEFAVEAAPGAKAQMRMNRQTGLVTISGEAPLVEGWKKIIEALDAPPGAPGQATQLLSLKYSKPVKVRQALEAVGGKIPAPAPRPAVPGTNFVTMLFQSAKPAQPDAQAQAPAAPAAQQAPAQGVPRDQQPPQLPAGLAVDNTPIGPVQIEFLDGLDVMVIRGNVKDVERVAAIINEIEQLSALTEPVIVVYPLEYVDNEAIAGLVSQIYGEVLSPRSGRVSITPLVKPNALLLIGREESVATLVDLIKRLDQPIDPSSQFQVFPLKHMAATQAKATVDEFFATRGGLDTKVRATADFRTNALIVQASARDLAEVAKLIERIDTATSGAVNDLQVFKLENSLAEELAPILQEAISGQPSQTQGPPTPGAQARLEQARSTMLRFMAIGADGVQRLKSGILTDVRITADPRANALLVSAPEDSLGLIGALIQQLDQMPAAEAQLKVFTIANGDATALIEMLQSLFGQARGAGAGGGMGGPQSTGAGQNPIVQLRFSVDQRTNSIIASGSASDLAVVEAILLRLDDSDVRQRQSTVYRLQNAPAIDVATAVNDLLRSERQVQQTQAGMSPFEQIEREVVVVPEPVSNSLIVSATPRFFEEIRRLVEQLDERPPMVMIQVLIAEVALNDVDEFGVELGLQDSLLFDRSLLENIQTTTNTTTTQQPGGVTVTTQNQVIQSATNQPGFNFNNNPPGNSGSAKSLATAGNVAGQALSSFAVGRVNSELGFGGLVLSAGSDSVNVLIRALQENRRLDILSRPQIMTLDNQPAFIQVGQRVPRINSSQTTEVGQVNSVVLENVGLILGVTPRISPDGLVVMEIDAEKSELGPEIEGIPISISTTGQVIRSPRINTTTAQTTVSAVSGQTVILGGLITKAKSEVHRRVPLLADIPILGHLFRFDNITDRRTELLIIMTPVIVRNEEDAELLKQTESARMHWVLCDVIDIHGHGEGLRSRCDTWGDHEVEPIYPDMLEGEPVLAPEPIHLEEQELLPPQSSRRTAPDSQPAYYSPGVERAAYEQASPPGGNIPPARPYPPGQPAPLNQPAPVVPKPFYDDPRPMLLPPVQP